MKISSRTLYLLGFILVIILISITFYLEKYNGFIPCPLCLLQRITFALLGGTFLLGVIVHAKKIANILVSLVATLFSLLGVLLSGRQVWLQHLPLDKNIDCGVSLQYLMNILPVHQVILRILHGTAECSQKGWEFLHLSLAEWSLFCFIGFLIFCLSQVKKSFTP